MILDPRNRRIDLAGSRPAHRKEPRRVAAIKEKWPQHLQVFLISVHMGIRSSAQFNPTWRDAFMEESHIRRDKTGGKKDASFCAEERGTRSISHPEWPALVGRDLCSRCEGRTVARIPRLV